MAGASLLRVVIVKPSKYAADGYVEHFRRGFMPNSTVSYLKSMTLEQFAGAGHRAACEVCAVDEYVHTDLDWLSLLAAAPGRRTLLALVGVQSHQLHRALDLAALARQRGVESCVIGGPHPMTCDTSTLHGRGVAFALAEAEIVWPAILADALAGELRPIYGQEQRWQRELAAPVLVPPSRRDLGRYAVRMLGVYPARGCPYTCNFCSVIKIAGRQVRSQPIETTLASMRAAKAAGVEYILFTSDNFNKYPEVTALCEAMIAERLELPFFAQCDAQVYRQEELVALMARAGCFQMFVGAESFSREALKAAHKHQNHPEHYARIVELCREHGISSHFSNILGFPSDTEDCILEHLSTLRRLRPDVASFYILTPIPGTEQYDDFLAQGLISERNLDRFDGSVPTWRHPLLSAAKQTELLFRCYREFNRARDVAAKLARLAVRRRDFRTRGRLSSVFGYSALSRYGAWKHSHPMAGGALPVRLDHARDYAALRRRRYGIDLAPLPTSLALSAADEELNRRAKLAVAH
ncbi:MAG TPA: B12-binding domain-containing radical SAM protein [Thermoanaerobaculia bacterium]|nr:B12-binding domain-containing radical SAM protein [Thermoanaerobaculia bacterium]